MPFVSRKQRGFMWANHPGIARRWEAETPKGADLPVYVPEVGGPRRPGSKEEGRANYRNAVIRALRGGK